MFEVISVLCTLMVFFSWAHSGVGCTTWKRGCTHAVACNWSSCRSLGYNIAFDRLNSQSCLQMMLGPKGPAALQDTSAAAATSVDKASRKGPISNLKRKRKGVVTQLDS